MVGPASEETLSEAVLNYNVRFMLSWVTALTLLPAAGCHLSQTLSIDCTAGMPCAEHEPQDADTDTDTDSDADTDTGSGPPSEAYAIAYTDGNSGSVIVYNADGSASDVSWEGYASMAGPVAYDKLTRTAVVLQANELVILDSYGDATFGTTGYSQSFDADAEDGIFWFDYGSEVGMSALDGYYSYLFDGSLGDSRGLAVQGGVAYVVDGETKPDLYKCVDRGRCSSLYADFDDSAARGRNVFFGPDGDAYGCTGAGAVYSLRDLSGGSTTMVAFYEGGLTDVSDCGWDATSEQFLLFSPSRGMIRMNPDSSGSVVTPIPAGLTGARADFFSE
jgi:hypothetical protein